VRGKDIAEKNYAGPGASRTGAARPEERFLSKRRKRSVGGDGFKMETTTGTQGKAGHYWIGINSQAQEREERRNPEVGGGAQSQGGLNCLFVIRHESASSWGRAVIAEIQKYLRN